jgi:hypothetical protein
MTPPSLGPLLSLTARLTRSLEWRAVLVGALRDSNWGSGKELLSPEDL